MIARACQGDREGRPYNTHLPVLHVTMYCTGDPRGRPGRPGSPRQSNRISGNHSDTL